MMFIRKIIGRLGGIVLWLPIWVVIRLTTRTRVLVVGDDQVLVLQGWLSTGAWGLPGGGKHRREKAVEAAVRELQEETGIVVKNTELRPLGRLRQTKGHAYDFYGFSLHLPVRPVLHLRKSEITNARWVGSDDIKDMRTEQHVQLLLDAWLKQR